MYSEKLENIPNQKYQDLMTYLSRAYSNEISHVRRRKAASKSDLDPATVQTIFSELCSEGILVALLQIRCPYCSTQHGKFEKKSDVPEEQKKCFNCGEMFDLNRRSNWEVIYRISGEPGDFFQENPITVKKFLSNCKNLSSDFFEAEFNRLKQMDNPQQRGQQFDYFIGLVFQQLPGVEVRTQESGKVGEVDVHVVCIESPDWVYRLTGQHTLVENKWEKDPIEKSEISKFYAKVNSIQNCSTAYFVSMSGFSRGQRKQTGALSYLHNCTDPSLRDLWDDDVEKMIEEGTPEGVLRERMLK